MTYSEVTKVFERAIRLNRPVVSSENKWTVGSRWRSLFYSKASLHKNHLISFQKFLDEVESYPVKFGDVPIEERKEWIDLLTIGKRLLKNTVNEKDKIDVKLQLIGLKYRIGSENGGLNPSVSRYEYFRVLSKLAAKWKCEQKYLNDRELTLQDIDLLNAASVYNSYIDILIQSKKHLNEFFLWTIRDHMDPAVMIEFPEITKKLVESGLHQRFGRLNRNGIKTAFVEKQKYREKHLTMLVEGKEKSILDENTAIVFRGGFSLTFAEVLEVFKNKYWNVGKLEVFKDGIRNWSALELGWWNAFEKRFERIDINQENWWKEMPLFETISKKEAAKRYGVNADGEQWIVSNHVTRGILNLSYEETHAFLEVAIPNKDQMYEIYSFGKYGIEFPKNNLDVLRLFAKTNVGKIAYPDDNVFCSHREHGYYAKLLNPAQGAELMQLLKEDVLKGRNGDLVYQIESDNCAKWTMEMLNGISGMDPLPNLYRMSLLDTEPLSPVRFLFRWIKKLPKSMQSYMITRLHIPLAPWRGKYIYENGQKVWKSLNTHDFWQNGEVYLPALMVKKQKERFFDYDSVEIEGKSTWKKLLELAVKPVEFICEFIEKIEESLTQALLEISEPFIGCTTRKTRSLVISCSSA